MIDFCLFYESLPTLLFSSHLLSFCLQPNATASGMRQIRAESLLSFCVSKLDDNQPKSPAPEEE
jgi:hypothetical protein